MVDCTLVVALDVGGTSVKSGLVNRRAVVSNLLMTPLHSQGSADEILQTLATVIRTQLTQVNESVLCGVALGFPGPFDYPDGICLIRGVDKFESLYSMNIRDELRRRLGVAHLPIVFRNDAEAAIVGEAAHGSGRGYERIIGLTLGTGIGSAFLVQGKPVTTGAGVPDNGWLYPIVVDGKQADDVFSIRGLLQQFHQAKFPVDDVAVAARLADEGDAAIQAVFADFGTRLGQFLHPFIATFRADLVLLTGGMAGAFPHFGEALKRQMAVPVVPGTLGTDAALIGAAQLLFDNPSNEFMKFSHESDENLTQQC